ncbi:MAG: hypothetical protein ABIZ05_15115 [Pseudonocardiaceae bacterium]
MTTTPLTPRVDVHREDKRFTTNISWLDSKHSFSFGAHYDPANTHHGLLLVNNDDIVRPGSGFDTLGPTKAVSPPATNNSKSRTNC